MLNRTLAFAKFQLVFGSAQTALDVPRRLAEITDADMRSAAAALRPETRTVLEVIPGRDSQADIGNTTALATR